MGLGRRPGAARPRGPRRVRRRARRPGGTAAARRAGGAPRPPCCLDRGRRRGRSVHGGTTRCVHPRATGSWNRNRERGKGKRETYRVGLCGTAIVERSSRPRAALARSVTAPRPRSSARRVVRASAARPPDSGLRAGRRVLAWPTLNAESGC